MNQLNTTEWKFDGSQGSIHAQSWAGESPPAYIAVLVHGYGVPLREAAELMEVSVATVRKHCDRAMRHLRTALEVSDAG